MGPKDVVRGVVRGVVRDVARDVVRDVVRDGDDILDQLIDDVAVAISEKKLIAGANREVVCHTDTWDKCQAHNIDVCIVVDRDIPNMLQINPLVWKPCSYYVSDVFNKAGITFKVFCREPMEVPKRAESS